MQNAFFFISHIYIYNLNCMCIYVFNKPAFTGRCLEVAWHVSATPVRKQAHGGQKNTTARISKTFSQNQELHPLCEVNSTKHEPSTL